MTDEIRKLAAQIPVSRELLDDAIGMDFGEFLRRAEEDRQAFEALPPDEQKRVLAERAAEAEAKAERERQERIDEAGAMLLRLLPTAMDAMTTFDDEGWQRKVAALADTIEYLEAEDAHALAFVALLGLAQAGVTGVDLTRGLTRGLGGAGVAT